MALEILVPADLEFRDTIEVEIDEDDAELLSLPDSELVQIYCGRVRVATEDGTREIADLIRQEVRWQARLRSSLLAAISRQRSERTILKWFDEYALSLDSVKRLPCLLGVLAALEPAVFWKALRRWWPACDDTWDYNSALLSLMRQHAGAVPRSSGAGALHDPRRQSGRRQGQGGIRSAHRRDALRVYRGCSRSRVLGISWTTNVKVAHGFAHGYRCIPVPDPVLATALISPTEIFVRINSRHEREVLLDPAGLVDLKIEPYTGT